MTRPRALDERLAPIAAVVAAAMLFGTTGTSQALGPASATSLGIGAVRLAVGALALAAIARRRRPGDGRAWRRHAPMLLLGGISVAVYQLGWFAGLRRTGVALGTVVGIGSGPAMAGLIHLACGRRGLTRGWVVGTGATVLGTGLLASRGAGESSADPVGLLLTLGAVLGYVLYVETARHTMGRGLDSAGAMAGMFGVGAILLAPILALEPLGWLASPRGAVMALHLGVVTIGVAYTLYGWGLRFLAVPTVVTLTLAEPLTAAILGTAMLGERLGPLGWIGAALIGTGLVVTASEYVPGAERGAEQSARSTRSG